jgi:hypothetical protein
MVSAIFSDFPIMGPLLSTAKAPGLPKNLPVGLRLKEIPSSSRYHVAGNTNI